MCMFVEQLDGQVARRKSALPAEEQEGNLSRQGAGSDQVPASVCAPSRQVGAHHAAAPLGITGMQSVTR